MNGEYRRKNFLNIATAVGVGITAVTVPFSVYGTEKDSAESAIDETKEDTKVKDKIILLVANLGHDDFKERDKATQSLIILGKKFQKDKESELSKVLKNELEKCKKSKDPEVKERAKKILLALTPAPPKIPVEGVDGGIPIAGDIAF